MTRAIAQVYREGWCYALHEDGSLYRRRLAGKWEPVPGRMCDWPEVGR